MQRRNRRKVRHQEKVVFVLDRNEPSNQHREQLDLTHLAKGVYFIQAITGDKTSSSKFVIK